MPDERCMCNERNVNLAYKVATQSVCNSDNARLCLQAQPQARGAQEAALFLKKPKETLHLQATLLQACTAPLPLRGRK